MKVNILIKNGTVIDPYLGTKEVRTVAVLGNKIVEATDDMEGIQEIDTTGCIVSPGLIDNLLPDRCNDLRRCRYQRCS